MRNDEWDTHDSTHYRFSRGLPVYEPPLERSPKIWVISYLVEAARLVGIMLTGVIILLALAIMFT